MKTRLILTRMGLLEVLPEAAADFFQRLAKIARGQDCWLVPAPVFRRHLCGQTHSDTRGRGSYK
jgi:hypothetical protein